MNMVRRKETEVVKSFHSRAHQPYRNVVRTFGEFSDCIDAEEINDTNSLEHSHSYL